MKPNFVKFSEIVIPENRIRKNFNEAHIEALARSLLEKGYIHPIAIRHDSFELVAGENRYRAHALLLSRDSSPLNCPDSYIPVSRISDLSADNILEAELEENLLREDLTWQEEVQAIAQLHEIRKSQNPDWTFADTATQLITEDQPAMGSQKTKVSEAIVISDHLDDPLIANAKTKKEAIKAIKDKNKQLHRKAAVENFDDLAEGATDNPHTLIHGDYFEESHKIPDGSFDVILTDPPYGIDIHKKGTFDSDTHEYDDSKDMFNDIMESLATESFRIAKDLAHCYVFCDIRRWPQINESFFIAGWDTWPRPLIWYKGNIGSFANADIGPRSTYEAIFYATKGHKVVQTNDQDVILVNQSTKSEHPANKPVELISNLLRRSAFPGDTVIDFFCGAGPIFTSASQCKAIATGIELNDKYHAMAHEQMMNSF